MYSMRCVDGPSVWQLVSIAMSLSVELGMHRQRDVRHANGSFAEEIRKRILRAVYNLDRHYAFTLCRAWRIADEDVDQTLPLDVDCEPLWSGWWEVMNQTPVCPS
jgi:hypothetical protein